MALPIREVTKPYDNSRASTFDVSYSANSFKLTVLSSAADGTSFYKDIGYIEIPAMDLGQFYMNIKKAEILGNIPSGTSFKVYTSTSTDAQTYSPYVQTDPDLTIKSPQGRYIRIKIEFYGARGNYTYTATDFNDADSSILTVDNQVILDGNMYLKTNYLNSMTLDSSVTDGKLFSTSLNKTTFKKIDSLGVV